MKWKPSRWTPKRRVRNVPVANVSVSRKYFKGKSSRIKNKKNAEVTRRQKTSSRDTDGDNHSKRRNAGADDDATEWTDATDLTDMTDVTGDADRTMLSKAGDALETLLAGVVDVLNPMICVSDISDEYACAKELILHQFTQAQVNAGRNTTCKISYSKDADGNECKILSV